jgi:predicted signal transduction protein with EAL and GGDEF domain
MMLSLIEESADHQDDDTPRVLCVDDDLRLLDLLARTLRCHGYQVVTATDADLAMHVIDGSRPFAVVVADLHLPERDGIELLRWLVKNSPDTAGILLTGNASLADAILSVNAGNVFRFLTKPCPPNQLIEAVAAAARRYEARRDDRLLRISALEHDELTGLPNQRRFPRDLKRLQNTETGANLSLMLIAIDDIELIRGTLGYAASDQVLLAAARRLQLACDNPRLTLQHAALYRLGDRLAVLWHAANEGASKAVAEYVLGALESEVRVDGEKLRLRGHAGLSDVLDLEPTVALRNAEAACREAIAAGAPRIARFSADTSRREQRRLHLSQRINHPTFLDNLSCVYQPQWDLTKGELVGLEALARWHDPDLGAVTPAEFIPIAEEDQEIAERLGARILLLACRQRQAWRKQLPDYARVAVNLSARQLRSGTLHEIVLDCLTQTGLPAELLELEITESQALTDLARSNAQLQALRREGISIALDDFGVGFSSLSYLDALPATSLKIDRSFIHAIDNSTRRADLVKGVCGLGHAMNLIVVVEGVESLATAAWLKSIGCDRAQGYAIARPLTATQFMEWYERERQSVAAALA